MLSEQGEGKINTHKGKQMLSEQGEGKINTHKGKQMLSEQGEGKINTQYTKVTAHYVPKKVMEPKDKNYIKEIIDEVKSSEYSCHRSFQKVVSLLYVYIEKLSLSKLDSSPQN